jgi:hypothetical protein
MFHYTQKSFRFLLSPPNTEKIMTERYVVIAGSLSEPIFHSKAQPWVSINFQDVYLWNSLSLAQSCAEGLNAKLRESIRQTIQWRVERHADIQEWYD